MVKANRLGLGRIGDHQGLGITSHMHAPERLREILGKRDENGGLFWVEQLNKIPPSLFSEPCGDEVMANNCA